MILPSKHLKEDRALLTLGADIIRLLKAPKTVSKLWRDFQESVGDKRKITYDWFVLALDLLFGMGLIAYRQGKIVRDSRIEVAS